MIEVARIGRATVQYLPYLPELPYFALSPPSLAPPFPFPFLLFLSPLLFCVIPIFFILFFPDPFPRVSSLFPPSPLPSHPQLCYYVISSAQSRTRQRLQQCLDYFRRDPPETSLALELSLFAQRELSISVTERPGGNNAVLVSNTQKKKKKFNGSSSAVAFASASAYAPAPAPTPAPSHPASPQ